jgi:glycerol-3-phosphate cytidylyltransferase
MLSKTLEKFGYPESLVGTHGQWHVLLRPGQVTLGSLVLICKEQVGGLGEISPEASAEQREVTARIEAVLKARLGHEKINYLALMMVDPEVHFHVIPRYPAPVSFAGQDWLDPSWPGPADISATLSLGEGERAQLLEELRSEWRRVEDLETAPRKKYSRLYTTGCFDIFHYGHLNILKRSKEICDHLIVGVSTDDLIEREKGRPPVIPYSERADVIAALEVVDEVIPQADKDKQKVVDQYSIDAITVGSDWKGRYPEVSCTVEYFDYTANISSTALKEALGLSFDRS